jgi:hypothetical protein
MNRILNASAGPYTLDVYVENVSAYRAEVRNEREDIVFAATTANIIGDGGVLEKVRNYFAAGDVDHVGAALVTEAEAELKAGGRFDMRPVVPGWKVAEVVNDKLQSLMSADCPADIRLTVALTWEQRAQVAAAAALAVKLAYDVRERT